MLRFRRRVAEVEPGIGSVTADAIVSQVIGALQDVPGIVGVVLGGSRARGTHQPTSDIDIGIYYDEDAGFDVRHLSAAAAQLDDERRENLVTPLGGWGPWVNAGGWLVVQGMHVDFILRDIHRVAQVIADCLAGKVSSHYQAGHPHAYISAMYMGELAICRIFHDPYGRLAQLKAVTQPYPAALQREIVDYFLFEAGFSLMHAENNIDKDDLAYVWGHCYRALGCLNQVLFALNEEYCINEKRAVQMVAEFPVRPEGYKPRIEQAISLFSQDPGKTRQGVALLRELLQEIEALTEGARDGGSH